jgi:hypothetical protein
MTKWFDILNGFKGFGNPEANIWFVGIEEGSNWSGSPEEDRKAYERYEKGYFWSEPQEENEYTSVYDVMSKIIFGLGVASGAILEYRDKVMFKKDGGVFQANLYPLGKPTVKTWPGYYKQVFGYGESEIERYKKDVRQTRFPELRKFWEQYSPSITICFGSTFWSDYKKLFCLDAEPDEILDSGYMEIFRRGKRVIYLTPFFSYRRHCMPKERIDKLVQRLRQEMA